MARRFRIALTMGDPAGIGPELAVRAAAEPAWRETAELVIYGAPEIIREAAARFTPGRMPEIVPTGELPFASLTPGQPDGRCGLAALAAVKAATLDVLAGRADAVVTAPMNKYSVNLAGIEFSGHTEYIAGLCGCRDFAMMQSAGALRIAFVTTHIPLGRVPEFAVFDRIVRVAQLLNDAIRREGVDSPSIAVAAINPHAGENGCMGREDEEVVKPAIAELLRQGERVTGPFPPDTLFIDHTLRKFDGILSMYHDQGHIPFKMLAFDRGVNSTLGLPIIRTSPDHGTAFEIAWRGEANPGSLFAAVELAIRRAGGRS